MLTLLCYFSLQNKSASVTAAVVVDNDTVLSAAGSRLCMDHFRPIAVLGRGHFGKVCTRHNSSDYYL